ncbi:DUF1835 domain-containing protein [Agarivorans gilvus]|uniref:DUF1835 domain-containing protein n=1 Tax=Agarivorans gilvus TaxID=680279 RepID=A0ABQ1HXU8_9ALTE|nr:DUF1835 domain-containing protein [Agarivorans gilvus]GGA94900.1 hypothetical protein GCM10007414_04540 [Agarivorans gilvus]
MQLHITNGDVVGQSLAASSLIEGEILCWRDVLHDGPIVAPEGEAYLKARAAFIYQSLQASRSFAANSISEQQLFADFKQRQHTMARLDQYSEIVLWFEHDLYDQLQLAECLYSLAKRPELSARFTLICIGEHAEVANFRGLGELSISQLEALYPQRQAISAAQLTLGSELWLALAAASPEPINQLLQQDMAVLPFMRPALRRFAEDYPWLNSGLTLTQQLILRSLVEAKLKLQAEQVKASASSTKLSFAELFATFQRLEAAPFLGDLWLAKELINLASLATPLLHIHHRSSGQWDGDSYFEISSAGQAILAGEARLSLDSMPSFWRGGVELSASNYWCWDPQQQRLCRVS